MKANFFKGAALILLVALYSTSLLAQTQPGDAFLQLYQLSKSQGEEIPEWLHLEVFGEQAPPDWSRSAGGNPGEAIAVLPQLEPTIFFGNSNNPDGNYFGLGGCNCIPMIPNMLEDVAPETGSSLGNRWFKGREDWYTFTLTTETEVWMSTCVDGEHNNFDTTIAILDESHDVVAMNDDWYECDDEFSDSGDDDDEDYCLELNAALLVNLPAGTYYAIVGGYAHECGNYVVEFSFVSQVVAELTDQPTTISLAQNLPNPFNPSTLISFSLQETAFTLLAVYDLQGQRVRTLVQEVLGRGDHQLRFDAGTLSSGVYFYVLDDGVNQLGRKMILLR